MTHLRHTWDFGDAHVAPLNPDPDEPPMSLWMVQRSVFDNALTERAARAGCDVRDGVAVKSVEPDGETRVRVTTADGEVYTASHVVGADGANGVVARMAGLRKKRLLAIALEAEIPARVGAGARNAAARDRPSGVRRQAGLRLGLSQSRASVGRRGHVRAALGRRAKVRPAKTNWRAGSSATWTRWAFRSGGKRSSSTATPADLGRLGAGRRPGTGASCWRATPPGWSTRSSATASPMPAGPGRWRAGDRRRARPRAGPRRCGRSSGRATTRP